MASPPFTHFFFKDFLKTFKIDHLENKHFRKAQGNLEEGNIDKTELWLTERQRKIKTAINTTAKTVNKAAVEL